jgi:nucleoside 2-deoxyribosyltransferase
MSESDRPLPIYLSASVGNAVLNRKLLEVLPADRFELVLPQDFTPDVPHSALERGIYEQCIKEMERSAAGLLLLDAFGIDCAMESGWYAASRKPLIGVANATARFASNWMVKGALTHFVTLEPALYELMAGDKIFAEYCSVVLMKEWGDLASVLEEATRS